MHQGSGEELHWSTHGSTDDPSIEYLTGDDDKVQVSNAVLHAADKKTKPRDQLPASFKPGLTPTSLPARLVLFLDGHKGVVIMTLATVYALYADDLRLAITSSEVDPVSAFLRDFFAATFMYAFACCIWLSSRTHYKSRAQLFLQVFYGVSIIVMVMFLVEWISYIVVKKKYLWSFFFVYVNRIACMIFVWTSPNTTAAAKSLSGCYFPQHIAMMCQKRILNSLGSTSSL